jgi:hypothetical protein
MSIVNLIIIALLLAFVVFQILIRRSPRNSSGPK